MTCHESETNVARTRAFDQRLEEIPCVCSGSSSTRSVPQETEVEAAENNDHAQTAGSMSGALLGLNKERYPRRRVQYGCEEERERARNSSMTVVVDIIDTELWRWRPQLSWRHGCPGERRPAAVGATRAIGMLIAKRPVTLTIAGIVSE